MSKTQNLYAKAKKMIPGGTQLLSKRPEMFLPNLWPAYYSKAKGCKVWDLDGNQYTDMSYMGIGANVLGYSDDDVNAAAVHAIENSSMCTLNAPEEFELAEKLIEIHPWAEMVRYAKTGGEAVSIAVRIARAYTGRDLILFCGYHGWSDWYLAANLHEDSALDGHLIQGLEPKGVPRGLSGTSIPFNYNNMEEFESLMETHKGKVAAVVMEPIREHFPEADFLKKVKAAVQEQGGVLIIDEVSAGFRLCCGGAHKVFEVEPDIAVFAKALGNGVPIAAIIGNRNVMEAAQDTFISSTYWTDRTGLAAAIATIQKYQKEHVEIHLGQIGRAVQEGWDKIAKEHGVKIHVSGMYPMGHFSFEYENALELKTLFTKEMLKKGFLATSAFYASYAHTHADIEGYLEAANDVFGIIKKGMENDTIGKLLDGQVCQSGFQRLT